MPHRMSTARLLCCIRVFAGNKLTHIGSTDTHSQLTFPTITDTVAYRRGYFYRLPEPEKNLRNPFPENIPTLYCSSPTRRQHAARQQELQPQTPTSMPSAAGEPMSTQAVLQQAGYYVEQRPIRTLLTSCRGHVRFCWAGLTM